MTINIDESLEKFLAGRGLGARYASFDYCFNHFQAARDANQLDSLVDGDGLVLSCLHLGFYLASWGMMRGSGELLQRSVQQMVPVVRTIAAEPASTWTIDIPDYASRADEVIALGKRIRSAYTVGASDILVTKTMLGVFGCVPAFDHYFRNSFGCWTLCRKALYQIGRFYEDNRAALDAVEVATLDFSTGLSTDRRYTLAKVVDMVFFQEGLNRSKR